MALQATEGAGLSNASQQGWPTAHTSSVSIANAPLTAQSDSFTHSHENGDYYQNDNGEGHQKGNGKQSQKRQSPITKIRPSNKIPLDIASSVFLYSSGYF